MLSYRNTNCVSKVTSLSATLLLLRNIGIVFYPQVCVGLSCLAGGWFQLRKKQGLLYSGSTITGKSMWLLQRTFLHDSPREEAPAATWPGGSTFLSKGQQRTHSQST